jgi:hypothetical protein
VSGVYSATNTGIVDESWTDKGQFLHVKVIPMNSLICNVTFIGIGSLVTPPAGFLITGTTYSSFNSCFTTRGSSVLVTANGVAITTATATSSFLNFNYTAAVGLTPAYWTVTP